MPQRDDEFYASVPVRRLLNEQMRALTPALQRCAGTHALLLDAAANQPPPALPMLGGWTCLHLENGGYAGAVKAALDEPLPFLDDAFDLVLLRHVLEVAPVKAVVLNEAVRVLAPGGTLVVTGLHPLSMWTPWLFAREWDHLRRPTLHLPARLRQHLERAGLVVDRVQRVGAVWPDMTRVGVKAASLCGGAYVLIARRRRGMVLPLRIKTAAVRVPARGQLSPGTRRSVAP